MIKKIWKYLLGGLAGTVLCGAVVGGVVSCSNGNQTQTTQTTQAQPEASKPTTSTAAYELTNRINTSAIAYKNPQTQTTNDIIMAATTQPDNYATLINEPNNVIISVLGTPEAVINVANDTSKTAPNITLNLNSNSTLYQQVLNGTNTTADLTSLKNLINFSTTKGSKGEFAINNQNATAFETSDTYSLTDFQTMWAWSTGNTISEIGKFTFPVGSNLSLGSFVAPTTLWKDIHAKNPTATFTTNNTIYWNHSKLQTSFNLTIDFLPFIKFSKTNPTFTFKTTPTVNAKDETSELNNPTAWSLSDISFKTCFEYQGVWYMNINDNNGFKTVPPLFPYDSKTNEIKSVNYMYFADGMIYVGTTAPTVL